MKTTALAIITLMLALFTAHSQEYQVELTLANRYMAPGTGIMLHDDPVVQGSVTKNFDHGLWANVWFSRSPDSEINLGDEVDFTGGWNGDAPEFLRRITGLDHLKAGLLIAYFDEPSLVENVPSQTPSGDPEVSEMAFDSVKPVEAKSDGYSYTDESYRPREPHLFTYNKGDMWLYEGTLDYSLSETSSVGFHTRHYQPRHGSGFSGGWVIGYHGEKTMGVSLPMNTDLVIGGELNWTHGFDLDSGFVVSPKAEIKHWFNANLTWSVIEATGYLQLSTTDARDDAEVVFASSVKYGF